MSGPLNITTTVAGAELAVLSIVGDLDVRTSDAFRDHVVAAVDGGHRHLVLDLAAVPFCDSSGLNALVHIHRHVTAAGGSVVLAAAPDRLVRMLTLTGVHRLLPLHLTARDALDALGPRAAAHPADEPA
ncbi:MAG TPA: STAS domain-containing protein [Thermomonospora sp.]|nr:STAS domain-containing protein [Thermomonospora sp.]